MTILTADHDVSATGVSFSEDAMVVALDDGRAISIPLAWYPRLLHGSPQERADYKLVGDGEGIHWPSLDEDISVEGLLAGRRSAETSDSLSRWLARRTGKEAQAG